VEVELRQDRLAGGGVVRQILAQLAKVEIIEAATVLVSVSLPARESAGSGFGWNGNMTNE
jgi:hypothetical protein